MKMLQKPHNSCTEIKERRPDTAVIFLTANDMESDMLKGFELGADDYVTKPFPISVFRKKVSRVHLQSFRLRPTAFQEVPAGLERFADFLPAGIQRPA